MKNINQQVKGAPKVGSGWQESIADHMTTTMGDDEHQEHVADDEGSNQEGKSGKGGGGGNEGGRQQRGQGRQGPSCW